MFHGPKRSRNLKRQAKNMMHRAFYHDWTVLLGETTIQYDNKQYILLVGFPVSSAVELYARLYDYQEEFIGGSFIDQLNDPSASLNKLPPKLRAIITEQARRMEKLGAFA